MMEALLKVASQESPDKFDSIPLSKITICLSNALDLIDSNLRNHHKQVAFLSQCIAKELGFNNCCQYKITMAGLLHDCGALDHHERLDLLEFDVRDTEKHSITGAVFLEGFEPLTEVSRLIRFHHARYDEHGDPEGNSDLYGGYILHLADRVSLLVKGEDDELLQADKIISDISAQSGRMFMPEVVEAFIALARRDYFWFELQRSLKRCVPSISSCETEVSIGLDQLKELSKLFCRLVDFRSPFTSAHSESVALTSLTLAKNMGFSDMDCELINVAGYFHDMGKLAVPAEILDKNGPLSDYERLIVKKHPCHTYSILEEVSHTNVGMAKISSWAALHHEHLDGKGYPFCISEDSIPLGAKIIAVADVFTALLEDRPYRKSMTRTQVESLLDEMVKSSHLDRNVVDTLKKNYQNLKDAQGNVYYEALEEYAAFKQFCSSEEI